MSHRALAPPVFGPGPPDSDDGGDDAFVDAFTSPDNFLLEAALIPRAPSPSDFEVGMPGALGDGPESAGGGGGGDGSATARSVGAAAMLDSGGIGDGFGSQPDGSSGDGGFGVGSKRARATSAQGSLAPPLSSNTSDAAGDQVAHAEPAGKRQRVTVAGEAADDDEYAAGAAGASSAPAARRRSTRATAGMSRRGADEIVGDAALDITAHALAAGGSVPADAPILAAAVAGGRARGGGRTRSTGMVDLDQAYTGSRTDHAGSTSAASLLEQARRAAAMRVATMTDQFQSGYDDEDGDDGSYHEDGGDDDGTGTVATSRSGGRRSGDRAAQS